MIACTTDGGVSVRNESREGLIGSVGIRGDALMGFGLAVDTTIGGDKHAVAVLADALPLAPGRYTFPAAALPSYRITRASSEKSYIGLNYVLFYEGDPKSSPPLTWEIDLKRVERLPGPAFPAGAEHVHLVGDFRFNAVYAPPYSEACKNDYMARMSYPMYNPAICGAEKVTVTCSFDVTGDVGPYPK